MDFFLFTLPQRRMLPGEWLRSILPPLDQPSDSHACSSGNYLHENVLLSGESMLEVRLVA